MSVVKIIIGADCVPTESNFDNFINGNMEGVIDKNILNGRSPTGALKTSAGFILAISLLNTMDAVGGITSPSESTWEVDNSPSFS